MITSPLTCKVAIDPITESNNIPSYVDINPNTLNMDETLIEKNITEQTIAIQVIHLGGVACNLEKIAEVAQKHNIPVIEDCAQGFGAEYKGIKAGTVGNVSCFSMIKNAYGISGGILATNNKKLYEFTKKELAKKNKTSIILSVFRIFRNLLESKRSNNFFNFLYHALMKSRGNKRSFVGIKDYINRPNTLDLKINYLQLMKSASLNQVRRRTGDKLIKTLQNLGIMENYHFNENRKNVYTKLFVYSKNFFSQTDIKELNLLGLECMHLEQKFNTFYQEKFINKNGLTQYYKIHDNLISIPLYENLKTDTIEKIINIIKEYIVEKEKNIN